jgi:hypothetical protein
VSATSCMQPLVLSWSGLLAQIYSGDVAIADLGNALFYFGCTRDHVFVNGVGGEDGEMQRAYAENPQRCNQIYRTLLDVILAAEADGRVVWRQLGQSNSYRQLNELLSSRGLPPVESASGYYLSDIHRIVLERLLPYRVISIPRLG